MRGGHGFCPLDMKPKLINKMGEDAEYVAASHLSMRRRTRKVTK